MLREVGAIHLGDLFHDLRSAKDVDEVVDALEDVGVAIHVALRWAGEVGPRAGQRAVQRQGTQRGGQGSYAEYVLVDAAMAEGVSFATRGNLNNDIGVPLTVFAPDGKGVDVNGRRVTWSGTHDVEQPIVVTAGEPIVLTAA